MTWRIGPIGNLLPVRSFDRGVSSSLGLPGAVHQIAGARGGRVVDMVGNAGRTWSAQASYLTADELSVFEGLAMGAYGSPPFALLDPWRRNLLTANQSSGTDVFDDTSGFRPNAGTVTSSVAQANVGTRSLAWAVTAAGQAVLTGPLLSGLADPKVDVPVLPSTAYSARVSGRLLGSTGTIRADIYWFTAAGTFISLSTGTATALSTGAFTTAPCTNVTSPANAALARLGVNNTAFGAATTIYLDSWQMELGAVVNNWVFGTGVPRVMFTGEIGGSYPIFPNVDGSITLTEV